MMTKRDEYGFGVYELLTVVVVCLILSCIVLVIAFRSSYNEKYRVMRYNAKMFALNAYSFNLKETNGSISLMELINEGMFSNIKNPFSGDKYCDMYESEVNFEGSLRYVTLKCGDYLIDHQLVSEEIYNIYHVTDWKKKDSSEVKKEDIKKVFYNYKRNDAYVNSDFYPEEAFLYLFNQNNNTKYNSIDEIPSTYNIVIENRYHTRKLIKEVEEE